MDILSEDRRLDISSLETIATSCPECGAELRAEKCKMVCRSAQCGYRIVFNCAEF